MPGLIGASIFSPRPARGYRFHSLQVEIIDSLRNIKKANISIELQAVELLFAPKYKAAATKFVFGFGGL
jgi:hypothetical protein